MKKRFFAVLGVLFVLLSGCSSASETTFEYVTDVYAPSPMEKVTFDLPEQAKQVSVSDDRMSTTYAPASGDYEIQVSVIPAAEGKDAVRRVTDPQQEGDEQSEEKISHTCVMQDGTYYYCLVFRVKPELEDSYRQCIQDVISSFDLAQEEL